MGLFNRLGKLARGTFGVFVNRMEEKNPGALLEDLKNQIDSVRREAEQQIIEIQTNAELINMELMNEERNLNALKDQIQAARSRGDKEILVELLMQEETRQATVDTYKNTYTNAVDEVKRIKEDFKSFEFEMGRRISEIKSLKSKARAAALKENMSAVNAVYVPKSNKLNGISESMERVRDIVNRKIAKANAVESLSNESPEIKMRRFEMESAKDAARARAEKLLQKEE